MISRLKQIIGGVLYRFRLRQEARAHRRAVAGKPVDVVFTEIFRRNFWGDQESVSGSGSNLEQTRVIVREIPRVLKQVGARTMLDLPCGDFNWMQRVDLSGVEYTGGDIVQDLIDRNQKAFGRPGVSFRRLNLIDGELPACDVLLCRDCLVHLSNEQILASLANIRKHGIRYLLTTSFTGTTKNKDIVTGEWRPINLEAAPFFLKPIEVINEECTEGNGQFADKSLILVQMN